MPANFEKRTNPRFQDGQFTYLFPLAGSAHIVEVIDSGSHGLGLSTRQPIAAGSKHWLQIAYQNGARRRFMVQILYCNAQGEGRYHCGARLVSLDQGDRLHWNSYQGFVRHKAVAAS
jgi:hypothetical protein